MEKIEFDDLVKRYRRYLKNASINKKLGTPNDENLQLLTEIFVELNEIYEQKYKNELSAFSEMSTTADKEIERLETLNNIITTREKEYRDFALEYEGATTKKVPVPSTEAEERRNSKKQNEMMISNINAYIANITKERKKQGELNEVNSELDKIETSISQYERESQKFNDSLRSCFEVIIGDLIEYFKINITLSPKNCGNGWIISTEESVDYYKNLLNNNTSELEKIRPRIEEIIELINGVLETSKNNPYVKSDENKTEKELYYYLKERATLDEIAQLVSDKNAYTMKDICTNIKTLLLKLQKLRYQYVGETQKYSRSNINKDYDTFSSVVANQLTGIADYNKNLTRVSTLKTSKSRKEKEIEEIRNERETTMSELIHNFGTTLSTDEPVEIDDGINILKLSH